MKGHNLDIAMYSLHELLNLFDIDTYDITREQMLAAIKRVNHLQGEHHSAPNDSGIITNKTF